MKTLFITTTVFLLVLTSNQVYACVKGKALPRTRIQIYGLNCKMVELRPTVKNESIPANMYYGPSISDASKIKRCNLSEEDISILKKLVALDVVEIREIETESKFQKKVEEYRDPTQCYHLENDEIVRFGKWYVPPTKRGIWSSSKKDCLVPLC